MCCWRLRWCRLGADIVSEFIEYVSDANLHVSRLAINGLARVALRVESCARKVLEHFLELLVMDVEHIRGQTLIIERARRNRHILQILRTALGDDIDVLKPCLV